jgi:PAS domain S-box-containing protein
MLSDNFIAKICPDGIIALGKDANIAGLNPAAETMFGWPQSELVGRPIEMLLPEGMGEGHAGLAQGFGENSCTFTAMHAWRIVEARRRDGGRFPVAICLIGRQADCGRQAHQRKRRPVDFGSRL